jgi:uridine kinase
MTASDMIYEPTIFTQILFEKMKCINPGIEELELYEFRYGLNNLYPENGGWGAVALDEMAELGARIADRSFFSNIKLKPMVGDRIVLDEAIVRLTQMLFVGLVTEKYPVEWVNAHFYFDIRGFYFLVRTNYFTEAVVAHLGGRPYKTFAPRQKRFERLEAVGYKEFKKANAEVDQAFIAIVKQLIAARGTPILLAIAGPTAAGKTEIVDRLRGEFEAAGQRIAAIEMDNFLTDRDDREAKGIHTLGKEALHFELFKQCLADLRQGQKIAIPRYDFIFGISSHDLNGNLKPGSAPIEIEPADLIFMEGNFPFLLEEIAPLIGIKVVYLTDDPVRLKRKWKRDIDLRKKYEPTYFRNRFFKDQFVMAEVSYRPQLEVCDVAVDTTGAAIWVTPEIGELLEIFTAQVQHVIPNPSD